MNANLSPVSTLPKLQMAQSAKNTPQPESQEKSSVLFGGVFKPEDLSSDWGMSADYDRRPSLGKQILKYVLMPLAGLGILAVTGLGINSWQTGVNDRSAAEREAAIETVASLSDCSVVTGPTGER